MGWDLPFPAIEGAAKAFYRAFEDGEVDPYAPADELTPEAWALLKSGPASRGCELKDEVDPEVVGGSIDSGRALQITQTFKLGSCQRIPSPAAHVGLTRSPVQPSADPPVSAVLAPSCGEVELPDLSRQPPSPPVPYEVPRQLVQPCPVGLFPRAVPDPEPPPRVSCDQPSQWVGDPVYVSFSSNEIHLPLEPAQKFTPSPILMEVPTPLFELPPCTEPPVVGSRVGLPGFQFNLIAMQELGTFESHEPCCSNWRMGLE